MFLIVVGLLLAVVVGFFVSQRLRYPDPKKFILKDLSSTVSTEAQSGKPGNVLLITGGCGFLASHMVELLLDNGDYDEIRLFDIRNANVFDHPKIKFIQGNILLLDDCIKAVTGCRAVLHTASIVDLRETEYMRALSWNVNVQGTWNMLEASIKMGVQGLVYTSSHTTVHTGKPNTFLNNETEIEEYWRMNPCKISYGATKRVATQLVLGANGRGDLKTAVVLPGFIFGPREPRLTKNIADGPLIEVHDPNKGGNQPLITVRSAARAHFKALDKLLVKDPKVCGELFFIFDVSASYSKLSAALRKALNKETDRTWPWLLTLTSYFAVTINWFTNNQLNSSFIQATPTSIELLYYGVELGTTEKAQSLLGWKPQSLEQSLKELHEYYNNPKKTQ